MPYCPRCRFEYLTTVHRCPDCGAVLVAELPPEPNDSALDDVLLCAVGGEMEAALLRSRLTAGGIPSRAQLGHEALLMGLPAVTPLPESVKLFVRRVDLERARAICRDLGPRGET